MVTAVRASSRQGNWTSAAMGSSSHSGAEMGSMRKMIRAVAAAKKRIRARSLGRPQKAAHGGHHGQDEGHCAQLERHAVHRARAGRRP